MNSELTPEEWLEEVVKYGFIIEYDFGDFNEIKIIGTGPGASTYTLVLEFANNGTLKEYLRENKENPKFDWKQKIELAKQLAGAISFLHHNNIVHRDLKSDNVLVSNGNIKLSDFGISRRLTESTNLLIRAFGSAKYSDPEHLQNPGGFSRTKKSDIYGLAMLLWEISSGTAPYKDFNTLNLVQLIVNKNYRETPVKGSPRKYVQLYQGCWESDPKNRPDANKVLNTLANFTEQDYEDVIDSCQALSTYKHLELSSIKFDGELTNQFLYPNYAGNSGILSGDNSPTPSMSPRISSYSSDESESLRSLVPDNNNIGHISNFLISYPYDDGQFNMNDFIDQMKYEARRFNGVLLNRFIYLTIIKEDVGIIIEDLKKIILLTNRNPELVYNSLQDEFSCLIGFFSEFGIGTEINELKALGIYLKVSQSLEPIKFIAQSYLVRFLEKNGSYDSINNDRSLLLQWFSKITSIMYGNTYLEHVKQLDKRKIFELFEEFANKDNNWGLYSVAWCYLIGIGVDKNEKKALRILLEAADKQNSLAQFQLSVLYTKGIGTDINIPEAEKWIKQAEEQKDLISIPYIQNFINSVISNNN
ncbi:9204_t:CDS:2 [Entrophospora sp. SA101]|nr:13467_t:CDS:2 [Entrophospora sp. SA101]CAJ0897244.1 9204_t:CDS:2 [Entrophospora sp. SA101]